MIEKKYLAYSLVGFSFSQVLGILISGFTLTQPGILFSILVFIVLIPGFLHWGGLQNKYAQKLSNAQIISCFVPSFIAVGILLIGFLVGIIVGV